MHFLFYHVWIQFSTIALIVDKVLTGCTESYQQPKERCEQGIIVIGIQQSLWITNRY